MRSRLILFLSLASLAPGAAITSNGSGDWGAGATWLGGVAPGAGDTATLRCQDTITVSDARVVGNSPAATGTAFVLTLQNDGSGNCAAQIHITSTGTLTVRGEVSDMGDFTFAGGGVLEMDAHLATTPLSQKYALVVPGGQTFRNPGIITSGTSANARATIRSNAGGGNAWFKNSGGSNVTFQVIVAYMDFLRIGDATNAMFTLNYWNAVFVWNVTNSTFTGCGIISTVGNQLPTNGTFIHSNNVHTSSATTEIFHQFFVVAAIGSGTREIKGNVFDTLFSATQFHAVDFTISGNYFGTQTWWGTGAWASYDNNFARYTDAGTAVIGGDTPATQGNASNTYYFMDTDGSNIHVLGAGDGTNCNITASFFGQGGSGFVGSADSGEWYFLSNSTNPVTCSIKTSIAMPNMAGYSSNEMGSLLVANPNVKGTLEHNTWFGGWNRGAINDTPRAFGMFQVGEGGAGIGAAGSIVSMKSNLAWNPQLANYVSGYFFANDKSQNATPADYAASAAAIDYNMGWNVNTTVSGTNAGALNAAAVLKGYALNSAGIGAHDVSSTNPAFICSPPTCIRTVETYDRSGLGNSPTAWSGGATYAIGDFVSSADATVPSAVYWGLTVNYRYINVGACASTNPKPGTGANWRDCWEWATLYRIRTDIAANGTASTFLSDMYTWLRNGWAPTSSALRTAGHDGTTIGAVPWTVAISASIFPFPGPLIFLWP